MGSFNITPITGDGYQLLRIADAVAADDPWLVTGDDSERFRFEIITSGTEAMNLQAVGGEGHVDLSWSQDDFVLLAGYNLYKSTSQDGTYTRINSNLIPSEQKTFVDTNVSPGQNYYYKFTVVRTEMSESEYSNVASATPIDTIPPTINHTPITTAPPSMPLTIFADVTDNVQVQEVKLYYRNIGESIYNSKTMVHTTGERYSTTLEGSLVSPPGLEYYLEANDGVSTVNSGRADYPYQVTVLDKPVVTSVTPNHGPSTGGTAVTISGANFKTGASVTFGGAVASDVSVLNSNQITCTTPIHFPEIVDVIVTNPDMQTGTLLGGYTFESETVSLSLPDLRGGQYYSVQIPINMSNVNGLAAASLTITFDQLVLDVINATTGSLTPGWSLVTNTSTPGQIIIAMASNSGTVSGSGTLANINFDIVGNPASSTTLHPSDILLNDGAIPVDAYDGSFTVDQVYSVSGQISFWNGGYISGTQLILEGDRVLSTNSDVDGLFVIDGAPSDDYTLTPSKHDEINGITAYDASLALQHDAELITLSGNAFTAGDVNKNSYVSSMDAFYILQKSADLITLPFTGAGRIWDFNPAERTLSVVESNQTNQNFTGILLGDPSGNWSQGGGMAGENSVRFGIQSITATLSLPEYKVMPQDQITIPLELTLTEGNLFGADIIITYDPLIVTVDKVDKGDIAPDWMIAVNLDTPGIIQVSMAGAVPISSNGELLSITFQAIGSSGSETKLIISEASLNEGEIPADLVPGGICVDYPNHIYLPFVIR